MRQNPHDGLTLDTLQTGVADIGPLAVAASHQGQGLGSRILAALEAEHPMTGVGVVSCRSDILPWYDKRGYITYSAAKLDKVRTVDIGDTW